MNTTADDPAHNYEIFYEDAAARDCDRLPTSDADAVDRAIVGFRTDPRPHGVEHLEGKAHRVRQGNWRIIYLIDDVNHCVVIVRVKRRNERTYKSW